MLDESRYHEALATRWLGRLLIQRERIDSTNLALKRTSLGQLPHGLLLFAEQQTHGRGQQDRRWFSEDGQNLTFSLALRPRKPACCERISLFSLLASLSVMRAIEVGSPDHEWKVKWPNDVLVDGQKVAGILTEVVFQGSRIDRIILGVGVNVNQTSFDDSHGIATSLKQIAGQEIPREPLLARILNVFEPFYDRWYRADSTLPSEINKRLLGTGEWVRVSVDEEPLPEPLKFLGADLKGYLHFLSNDLTITTFRYEQIRIDPLP